MFMILVARCLERVGDNTVDIAEQVVFVVTGLFRELCGRLNATRGPSRSSAPGPAAGSPHGVSGAGAIACCRPRYTQGEDSG